MPTIKKIAFTQPFPQFPHVIVIDGTYFEICCPQCNGNSRHDFPHSFFSSPKRIVSHIGSIHKEHKTTTAILLKRKDLRKLQPDEVIKIQGGQGVKVITRKVAVKVDGKQASPIDYPPVPLYSNIIKLPSGSYAELRCFYCDGNARIQRGQLKSKNPTIIFCSGLRGMAMHLFQAHNIKLKAGMLEEMCGTPIRDAYVRRLKIDVTGMIIPKILMTKDKNEDKALGDSPPKKKGKKLAGFVTKGRLGQIASYNTGSTSVTPAASIKPPTGGSNARVSSLASFRTTRDSPVVSNDDLSQDDRESDEESDGDDYDPTGPDDLNELERRIDNDEV